MCVIFHEKEKQHLYLPESTNCINLTLHSVPQSQQSLRDAGKFFFFLMSLIMINNLTSVGAFWTSAVSF